jgi:putative sigma-54 modulation protein
MRLVLTGRHVVISPALRAGVEARLARLERKLFNSIVSVQVVLTREDARHRAEATLHARGDHFLHGESTSISPKAALDGALKKIERQAGTLKGKWTSRRKAQTPEARRMGRVDGAGAAERPGLGSEAAVRIVRARRYVVKPMSIDDAALQVGSASTSFVVFRNAVTDVLNVLFRRPDGHLGLIEPEE